MNNENNNTWIFAINNDCQFQGINSTGVSLFKGEPIKSLTREICQNSIDARLDTGKPVRVEFKTFTIPLDTFPAVESLRKAYEDIFQFADSEGLQKAAKTVKNMLPHLYKNEMRILRISDYNTRGLEGADNAKTAYKSPWNRLVRSEGSSDKQEGSMGSYGSGHLAVYATSSISTVLYSTMDCTENRIEACEGVARLMGHRDANGDQHSDVGYLGSSGTSLPIMHQLNLQPGFKRKEPGTDIYSVAFKYSGNQWKNDLVAAVLDGFFYAILSDNLVVEAEDVTINRDTISRLIKQYKESIDPRTLDYYSIWTDDDLKVEHLKMYEDSDVSVKMKIQPELCRRIAIVRWPGMKIFDKGNISSTVPFAGVCIIKGKRISELFKGLENIQHTKWELERYSDEPDIRREAEKKQKLLYKSIKEIFENSIGETATERIDPDIGDCLPDPSSDKEKEKPNLSDETAEITVKKSPHPTNADPDEKDPDGNEGGGSGVSPQPRPPHPPHPGPIPPFPGPGPGPNPGPNPGPTPAPTGEGAVKSLPARIRPIGKGDGTGKYKLIILPRKEIKEGYAKISLAAETGKYEAGVVSAGMGDEELRCSGDKIYLPDTPANNKLIIEIEVDHKDMRSLEVKVYGK